MKKWLDENEKAQLQAAKENWQNMNKKQKRQRRTNKRDQWKETA